MSTPSDATVTHAPHPRFDRIKTLRSVLETTQGRETSAQQIQAGFEAIVKDWRTALAEVDDATRARVASEEHQSDDSRDQALSNGLASNRLDVAEALSEQINRLPQFAETMTSEMAEDDLRPENKTSRYGLHEHYIKHFYDDLIAHSYARVTQSYIERPLRYGVKKASTRHIGDKQSPGEGYPQADPEHVVTRGDKMPEQSDRVAEMKVQGELSVDIQGRMKISTAEPLKEVFQGVCMTRYDGLTGRQRRLLERASLQEQNPAGSKTESAGKAEIPEPGGGTSARDTMVGTLSDVFDAPHSSLEDDEGFTRTDEEEKHADMNHNDPMTSTLGALHDFSTIDQQTNALRERTAALERLMAELRQQMSVEEDGDDEE